MLTIKIKNLTHTFSNKEIGLDNVNLNVPKGAIYGFLGPNGAGKTTTLKLLLGLLKIQKGQVQLFNSSIENNRNIILKNVGSLIESPSIYLHLTAKENLIIWKKLYKCSYDRIDEVLNTVGLYDVRNKRTNQFSLGMKQRLGIAISLLHNPELLILDEPINGLDPTGIIEIRDLLLKINREENKTIVISSHLLSEIEKLVSHVGIINKGVMLFEGTLDELYMKNINKSYVVFETSDCLLSHQIIKSLNIESKLINEQVSVFSSDKSIISSINTKLVMNNIEVYQISTFKSNLESFFMDLTKNNI